MVMELEMLVTPAPMIRQMFPIVELTPIKMSTKQLLVPVTETVLVQTELLDLSLPANVNPLIMTRLAPLPSYVPTIAAITEIAQRKDLD